MSAKPNVRPVLHVVALPSTSFSNKEYMEPHLDWVRKYAAAGIFLFAGSFEERATGGMIIARTESRAALDRILSEDPFLINGVATHHVTTFNVSIGSLVPTLAP